MNFNDGAIAGSFKSLSHDGGFVSQPGTFMMKKSCVLKKQLALMNGSKQDTSSV